MSSRPCPIPAEPGVYGWFFRSVPGGIETAGCVRHQDLVLLYTGISPKRPSVAGKASSQNLRSRVRYHYTGNAEGSTLRKTLGCLLSDEIGTVLRRVGSGTRMTFSEGEKKLTEWMAQNALVIWSVHPEPWAVEENLIATVDLPLNLDQNRHNSLHAHISGVRSAAVRTAKSLPILPR